MKSRRLKARAAAGSAIAKLCQDRVSDDEGKRVARLADEKSSRSAEKVKREEEVKVLLCSLYDY